MEALRTPRRALADFLVALQEAPGQILRLVREGGAVFQAERRQRLQLAEGLGQRREGGAGAQFEEP